MSNDSQQMIYPVSEFDLLTDVVIKTDEGSAELCEVLDARPTQGSRGSSRTLVTLHDHPDS